MYFEITEEPRGKFFAEIFDEDGTPDGDGCDPLTHTTPMQDNIEQVEREAQEWIDSH